MALGQLVVPVARVDTAALGRAARHFREALDVLVENVRAAQDALPVPLALENVAATLAWPEDELDEPDFLTELVARTGCWSQWRNTNGITTRIAVERCLS